MGQQTIVYPPLAHILDIESPPVNGLLPHIVAWLGSAWLGWALLSAQRVNSVSVATFKATLRCKLSQGCLEIERKSARERERGNRITH